jgi:cytochrome c553
LRTAACCLALALAAPLHAQTAPADDFAVPGWAVPNTAAPKYGPDVAAMRHTIPGSRATFTRAEIDDRFRSVDWFPRTHVPAPHVVTHGRAPGVLACAFCHLPDGSGRPENAMLAGLPKEYIVRQMSDFHSRARRNPGDASYLPGDLMRGIADSIATQEIETAARYFSRLRPRGKTRVVEADTIPRPVAGLGLHSAARDGSREPLGRRLIEMPNDIERHELRDPNVRYTAYVPRGSIARGRAIATRGLGQATPACVTCHGPRLRGTDTIPALAGRAPSSLLRQLIAFRTGTRASAQAAPMRALAATLSLDDMIAAAAYAGSLSPMRAR